MTQRRQRIVIVFLSLLAAALLFLLLTGQREQPQERPDFQFGFVSGADIPTLMEGVLAPEHLTEEQTAGLYDGSSLAPWLLSCESVTRVEYIDGSVYLSYRPSEPEGCDQVVLHYRGGRITDIVTSWEGGSRFLTADLDAGQFSWG